MEKQLKIPQQYIYLMSISNNKHNEININNRSEIMIKFDFINDYPVVEIKINRNNKTSVIKTIIDTGSPYTILPNSALEPLGLGKNDAEMKVRITGIINKKECEVIAPAYTLDIFVDEFFLANMLILEYDFHKSIGLLGHNVLKRFQLLVNWKKKLIRLE